MMDRELVILYTKSSNHRNVSHLFRKFLLLVENDDHLD
jgi:hypothetical protein